MKRFAELTSATGKVYLTIDYDMQNDCIYNNWTGYSTPENVRAGGLAVLDAIGKYKTTCCLNDNRELVGRWDDAVDWIAEEWTPLAVKAGLKYFAHIVDKETFAALSASEMKSRTDKLFEMRIFESIDEAITWLSQVAPVTAYQAR